MYGSGTTTATNQYYYTSTYDEQNLWGTCTDLIMSKEKETKKTKQSDTKIEVKSELLKWFDDTIGLSHGNYNLLLHSPMYNPDNSDLVSDFNNLHVPYGAAYTSISVDLTNDVLNNIQKCADNFPRGASPFKNIFVEGILEHLPNNMMRALVVKSLVSMLTRSTKGYIILHTLSNDHIKDMIGPFNLQSQDNGYVVNINNNNLPFNGIENDESNAIIAFARIQSITISKDNIFKNFKDSCTLINNGV